MCRVELVVFLQVGFLFFRTRGAHVSFAFLYTAHVIFVHFLKLHHKLELRAYTLLAAPWAARAVSLRWNRVLPVDAFFSLKSFIALL